MPISAYAVDLLLPPASLALIALLAVTTPGRWGRRVAVAALVPLVLLSMPLVGQTLLAALDPIEQPAGPPPDAIVILSADTERTPVHGRLDIGPLTLERERTGAALARATGLPILVTGGLVNGPPPVAALMVASMSEDFGVPVRWAELHSATTWENAQFSAPMLKESGVKRVYLVTHAWHMRRALLAFRRAGVDAVPAIVRADPWPRGTVEELVPRVSALGRSYYAIHEWIGLAYYWWRND